MRSCSRFFYALLLALPTSVVWCETQSAEALALVAKVSQEMQSAVPTGGLKPSNSIRFVVGNAVWQPGNQYFIGADWLALACTAKGCILEPASLEVKAESVQGQHDEEPTAGQMLKFKRAAPSHGKVVAWLRMTNATAWLKPGKVPTYHSTAIPLKQPQTAGTLESLVELPSGKSATLVPMLLREKAESWGQSKFLLQLRSGDRRQFLAGEFGTCSKTVDSKYLLWAGDLDGDGKADYLVSFVDVVGSGSGPIHLYLSSRANDKYLVGLAGIHYATAPEGGCD